MSRLRIVFMGTPAYGAASLQALVDAGYQVCGVFTQPDRPRGRRGKTQPPPVKLLAQQHGIPVYQPARISRDGIDDLRRLQPDLAVTAAFGQILSQELLDIPRLGTVNVHASLLPAYRGSAPVNWCLIHGETVTGVTTMMTDRGIDTGDILLQRQTKIAPDETAGQLTDRLAAMGAGLLVETIALLEKGTCPRTRQDERLMSYHPMLKKEMGRIDWSLPADRIVNLVRGLNPWPCAFTDSPHGILRLLTAKAEQGEGAPGTVLEAEGKRGLLVAAGEGAVRVLTMQAQGGKAMPSPDYLRGHALPPGTLLASSEREAEGIS